MYGPEEGAEVAPVPLSVVNDHGEPLRCRLLTGAETKARVWSKMVELNEVFKSESARS